MPCSPPKSSQPVESNSTGWFVGIIVALALLAIAYLVLSANAPAKPRFFHEPATAHVMLSDATGHGSGVHIGNGYIITAAHVAGANKTMAAKASDGSTREAAVLWSNDKYDIALLRVPDPQNLAVVPLSCETPARGEKIRAFGNPIDLEFVWTSGEVVGVPISYGPWPSVVPVNMTIVPGQSGGADLNDDGEVVGISVGVMVSSFGMAGIGYIVPASTVCMLLART